MKFGPKRTGVVVLVAVLTAVGLVPGVTTATNGLGDHTADQELGPTSDGFVCERIEERTYACVPVAMASENESINVGEGTPLGAEIGVNISDSGAVEVPITVVLYESASGVRPACTVSADALAEECKVFTDGVPPHTWDMVPVDAPNDNPLPVSVPGEAVVFLLLQYPEQIPNIVVAMVYGEVDSAYPEEAPVHPSDLPVQLYIPSDPTFPDDLPLQTENPSPDEDEEPNDTNSDTSDDDGAVDNPSEEDVATESQPSVNATATDSETDAGDGASSDDGTTQPDTTAENRATDGQPGTAEDSPTASPTPTGDEGTPTAGSAAGGPGFGLALGWLALLATVVLARFRP